MGRSGAKALGSEQTRGVRVDEPPQRGEANGPLFLCLALLLGCQTTTELEDSMPMPTGETGDQGLTTETKTTSDESSDAASSSSDKSSDSSTESSSTIDSGTPSPNSSTSQSSVTTSSGNDSTEPPSSGWFDDFASSGPLLGYQTNNADAIPSVGRVDGRYHAPIHDNTDNKTLHFNDQQGRLDARLVEFPFEVIVRNIGIGTVADSQTAPTGEGNPFLFAGVQVHVVDFASINSSHVVVGHRGNTHFTVEGKNTVDGRSSVNDAGANIVPDGRADLKIVGTVERTLRVYWQTPNANPTKNPDHWTPYLGQGTLPGHAPAYGAQVYVGLITYAYQLTGLPFVGTADSIQYSPSGE